MEQDLKKKLNKCVKTILEGPKPDYYVTSMTQEEAEEAKRKGLIKDYRVIKAELEE